MRSKRLLIHIGTEKTGTTSIQHFLNRNAAALAARGIWYPTDSSRGYCDAAAHFPLAGALVDNWHDFVHPSRAQFLPLCATDFSADARASPAATTVVSSEHFSSRVRDAARLAAFRRTLASTFDDIRIVCYLRNQADLALSSHATRIIFGGRAAFDPAQVSTDDPYFNYLAMLDLWASVFGSDALVLREYDRRTLASGDVCRDFVAKVLDIGDDGLVFSKELNPTPGAILLEITRQLNLALPTVAENPAGWRSAQRLRSILLSTLTISNDVALTLTTAQRQSLLSRFEACNRAVNMRYMKGAMSPHWFDASASGAEDKVVDPDFVNAMTMNALSKLVINFLQTLDKR